MWQCCKEQKSFCKRLSTSALDSLSVGSGNQARLYTNRSYLNKYKITNQTHASWCLSNYCTKEVKPKCTREFAEFAPLASLAFGSGIRWCYRIGGYRDNRDTRMLHGMEYILSFKFKTTVQKASWNHSFFVLILIRHLMDELTVSTVQKLTKGETPYKILYIKTHTHM